MIIKEFPVTKLDINRLSLTVQQSVSFCGILGFFLDYSYEAGDFSSRVYSIVMLYSCVQINARQYKFLLGLSNRKHYPMKIVLSTIASWAKKVLV